MKREDEPLGLLHYVKSTFEDSLFSKVLDEVGGSAMVNIHLEKVRKNSKAKFKMIEAYSKLELEKAVDKFLAGDIKLVDWRFNSYDGYYMFTCTYREEDSNGESGDKKPTSSD